MAATLGQLVKVRSQKARAMVSYVRAVEGECGKNPLLERFGRRLADLWVPLRVVPLDLVRDIEEIRAREHFRQAGVTRDADEERAAGDGALPGKAQEDWAGVKVVLVNDRRVRVGSEAPARFSQTGE